MPDLILTKEHRYLYGKDKILLPGVTTVIKDIFNPFAFNKVNPVVLQLACQLGTDVHEATELIDRHKPLKKKFNKNGK